MTRKDYVKFAELAKTHLTDKSNQPADYAVLKVFIDGIVDILAEDNPRFDRVKFYKACGVRE